RVARDRRPRLGARPDHGAVGVHHRLLHHAVVRALWGDVPLPVPAARRARSGRALPAALVPDRAQTDRGARGGVRGGAGAGVGAGGALRAAARPDPLADEAAPRLARRPGAARVSQKLTWGRSQADPALAREVAEHQDSARAVQVCTGPPWS